MLRTDARDKVVLKQDASVVAAAKQDVPGLNCRLLTLDARNELSCRITGPRRLAPMARFKKPQGVEMAYRTRRRTVDLSGYPDLVVIYLGMRVNALTGLKTLLGFGPRIANATAALPDGLLLHESFVFSLIPPHFGMRQYWRDFASLETWARSEPHRVWWRDFLRDSGGTGFWHETYCMAGGMEAVYVDMAMDVGFLRFAPIEEAKGSRFSARGRTRRSGEEQGTPPIAEEELYR